MLERVDPGSGQRGAGAGLPRVLTPVLFCRPRTFGLRTAGSLKTPITVSSEEVSLPGVGKTNAGVWVTAAQGGGVVLLLNASHSVDM